MTIKKLGLIWQYCTAPRQIVGHHSSLYQNNLWDILFIYKHTRSTVVWTWARLNLWSRLLFPVLLDYGSITRRHHSQNETTISLQKCSCWGTRRFICWQYVPRGHLRLPPPRISLFQYIFEWNTACNTTTGRALSTLEEIVVYHWGHFEFIKK